MIAAATNVASRWYLVGDATTTRRVVLRQVLIPRMFVSVAKSVIKEVLL